MSEGSIPADLIVILAIAVFVIYKYRQILGHKTGHDVENPRDKLQQRKQQSEQRVVQLRQYQGDADEDSRVLNEPQQDEILEAVEDEGFKKTIAKMQELEADFRLDEFVEGSKGAFDMVMEAFESQDRSALKMLLTDELYSEFDQELKQYAKRKQRPQTTLVSILSATPISAVLKKQQAALTVRFVSEQIHFVKNEAGEIIDGDSSRIDQVVDEWVFERKLGSRNPNWTITDM